MRIPLALSICLACLTLGGCAGNPYRLESSDPALTDGWFNRQGDKGWKMALKLGDKDFKGQGLGVTRRQDRAELRKRYGAGSKHFERIFSGLDVDHYVYTVAPILYAEDGLMLRCSITWLAWTPPAGSCTTIEGERVEVRFKYAGLLNKIQIRN